MLKLTQKKSFKYNYYSCIDAKLTSPQPEQHYLCNKKAIAENGRIIFYGAEDYAVHEFQPYILSKLSKTSVDGVIFFTFSQFCYLNKPNIILILKLLKKKLSIHFARENISIYTKKDFDTLLPVLIAFHNSVFFRQKLAIEIINFSKKNNAYFY